MKIGETNVLNQIGSRCRERDGLSKLENQLGNREPGTERVQVDWVDMFYIARATYKKAGTRFSEINYMTREIPRPNSKVVRIELSKHDTRSKTERNRN